MNARGLLIGCIALIMGSIVLVPASAHFGVHNDTASVMSSLTLLGSMAAAYMTVGEERKELKKVCRQR